jgi:hypothetical protein
MQELANKQQIKLVAQGLTLSAELSVKLLKSGSWQPTDRVLLLNYLNSLHNSIEYLTDLVKEQFVLSEAETILRGLENNE